MRSVFAYFKRADLAALSPSLEALTVPWGRDWSVLGAEDGLPVLYVAADTSLQLCGELEDEELDRLVEALGGLPSLALQADITHRHRGKREAVAFLTGLLRVHEGVARDDYGRHFWTWRELMEDAPIDGYRFMDPEPYP